jgi:hypothetical protein
VNKFNLDDVLLVIDARTPVIFAEGVPAIEEDREGHVLGRLYIYDSPAIRRIPTTYLPSL